MTRTNLNMMNATNPYFDMTFGPRSGQIRLKKGLNVADMIINGSLANSTKTGPMSDSDKQKMLASAAQYKQAGLDANLISKLIQSEYFPQAVTASQANPLTALMSGYSRALASSPQTNDDYQ